MTRPRPDPVPSSGPSAWLPWVLFTGLFGLYLTRANPAFLNDDSAETLTAGHILGLAHSPGYLPGLDPLGRLGGPGRRAPLSPGGRGRPRDPTRGDPRGPFGGPPPGLHPFLHPERAHRQGRGGCTTSRWSSTSDCSI
jgi:hypothetical protein